jgi:hypothetical protein
LVNSPSGIKLKWYDATDKNPSQFVYDPDFTQPGIDDGHIVSNAGRISWQVSGKDKISVYHDEQHKYRDHWGIASTIPPEAAGVQVTPTSRVNVSKWTRTHTNKLLLEGGFGYYNQEYTELYQPSVTGIEDKVWDENAIRNSKVYNVLDQSNNRQANVGTGGSLGLRIHGAAGRRALTVSAVAELTTMTLVDHGGR